MVQPTLNAIKSALIAQYLRAGKSESERETDRLRDGKDGGREGKRIGKKC